jgi:hypothetical protein
MLNVVLCWSLELLDINFETWKIVDVLPVYGVLATPGKSTMGTLLFWIFYR